MLPIGQQLWLKDLETFETSAAAGSRELQPLRMMDQIKKAIALTPLNTVRTPSNVTKRAPRDGAPADLEGQESCK